MTSGAFAKLRKANISVVMSVRLSVRPRETNRLPLDGFSWNLIFGNFSKICRENSSVIKMGQECRVLYMKTNIHFWSHLAHFFLGEEMQFSNLADSSWNVMAHGDAREGKWRGNWRMECVASTLNTTSEHGVSSITTSDAHTSAASSRLNWRPRRFKRTRPFRRKTKYGFCVCAITFQLASTIQPHIIQILF